MIQNNQMLRCVKILAAVLLVAGCASTPPEKLRAERPSLAAYLRPASVPGVPVDVLDRDLTREVWSDDFRTVVTPLTVPLIARIAALECRKLQCSTPETRRMITRLTNAFASNRSCFYLVVSEVNVNDKPNVYSLRYHNEGGQIQTASRLPKNLRNSSYYRVQRKLLDQYLPASYRSQVRNTLGFRSSTADIVCGTRIDFSDPFVFHVDPKGPSAADSKKLVWTVIESRK